LDEIRLILQNFQAVEEEDKNGTVNGKTDTTTSKGKI